MSTNNHKKPEQHEFYESLRAVGDFLVENRAKTDFVLDCFFQQENMDIEEMGKAEGNISQAQKFDLRMHSKREQVEAIKAELTNLKFDRFRTRVAELLQWISFILDPPKIFEQKFPPELKNYLSAVRRFENDVILMAGDVNRKFKTISTSKTMPPS